MEDYRFPASNPPGVPKDCAPDKSFCYTCEPEWYTACFWEGYGWWVFSDGTWESATGPFFAALECLVDQQA